MKYKPVNKDAVSLGMTGRDIREVARELRDRHGKRGELVIRNGHVQCVPLAELAPDDLIFDVRALDPRSRR